jgi:hypothetical protein
MRTTLITKDWARALKPGLGRVPALVLGLFAMGVGIGVGAAMVAFMLGALRPGAVQASHDASGGVHACVSNYTGQPRFMRPGQAPNCTGAEFLVELGGAGAVAALQAQVDALQAQVPDCLAEESGDAVFTGCDVEIRDGMGSTATQNGKGNLIVGYNENSQSYDRTGSHNIVVGKDNGYSSYGGLVAGQLNQITGSFASVSGGSYNTASGKSSSVSGGDANTASGYYSSVSGGYGNEASNDFSSVSGGSYNEASGADSSVSGGQFNEASGADSSVSGGSSNEASNTYSSVSGGSGNVASGLRSSVSGGANRSATGDDDWAAGGQLEDH